MDNIWILAQAEGGHAPSAVTSEPVAAEESVTSTTAQEPNAAPTAPPPSSPFLQFLPIILIFLVMYLFLFKGPRKQKQQRKKLVQSLEKNDRVQTIGGIIGTIVNIKGDEVTLKVDESNNTKITFVSSAIGRNLSKENQ